MNLFLISNGNFDYDGRLRELYKVFSEMGTLYSITQGSVSQDARHKVHNGSYISFIKEAVKYGKTLEKIDVLVLDNRKSIIPGLMLKASKKPAVTIQDCRELYVKKEVPHFAGKMGCVIEKWGIDRSDIIICANKERADIMKEMFSLKDTPIVYENLRRLVYSSDSAEQLQKEKFAHLINDDEIRLISSSGCSVSRTNDVLVSNLDRVEKKCRLFLVGGNTDEDEEAIRSIMKNKGLDNVEILGQVNQDELKYLISVSHIGIVNYHQKDTNNKYCASGKVYEFIYDGVPVVTTTNPPLKNMCDGAHIGEADDNYADGINKVMTDYDGYREAAKVFASKNPVEENNNKLLREIKDKIAQLTI